MFMKLFFLFLLINSTIGFLQLWAEQQQSEGAPNALFNTETNSSINFIEGEDFANRTTFDQTIYLRNEDEDNQTLVGNIRNPSNSSLTFGSADIFTEQSDIEAFEVWGFTRFFTGGFILDSMERFTGAIGMELPVGFVDSLTVVIGLIFALWMFFLVTGRGFALFT